MTDASTLIGSNFHALLIGIDCYLPNKLPDGACYKNLNGCVRDINYVEAFLKNTLKLSEAQILKLTASHAEGSIEPVEPKDRWPTYENIVTKFNELIEKAQPQDQVYIHYSGHGGRAATIFPEIKGEKGIDEGLVPVDIGNSNARYLRDLEIAALLQKMADKQLVVTLVLDSCHSGGSTRSGDSDIRGADMNTVDTTVRPIESLVTSSLELAEIWQALTEGKRAATIESMLPEVKGCNVLAACRPNEYAFEYPFNGKEKNGALTYWLLDSLQNPTPNLTYKALYDRLNAKIHSQFSRQTPMLFGEGNRKVFGRDFGSYQYAVTVMQVDNTKNPVRIRLNAGQAQGLDEGGKFAIYLPGTTDLTEEDKQLAIAEIVDVGATDAWAEITQILRQGAIEQGAQAVMLSAPVDLMRKVRSLYCTEENTKPENLPPKSIDQKAALQAVESAIAGNGSVRLVSDNEVADYQVAINKNGEYEICDPSRTPLPNLRPALKVAEDAATQIVKRLVHITKYKATEEIDNFGGNLTSKLVVELVGKQANYKRGRRPAPQPFDDPLNPTVKSGETIFLRIKNESTQPLNIVVLVLSSDWSISQQNILDSQDFVVFDAGYEEPMPTPFTLTVPEGYTETTEIFKVFATVGEANFRWLELPELDRPIPPSSTRGLKAPRNRLEEILAAVGADDRPCNTKKAEAVVVPNRGWTMKQVTVKVIAN
jgi:Caspase domain